MEQIFDFLDNNLSNLYETYQLIGGKKVPFRERAILEEECALVLSEENAKRTGRH